MSTDGKMLVNTLYHGAVVTLFAISYARVRQNGVWRRLSKTRLLPPRRRYGRCWRLLGYGVQRCPN